MEYTTEFNDSEGICTVRVTGLHMRPDDSLVLQQLARNIGDERGIQRFLFDMTKAKIVGETIDTFQVGIVPLDSTRKQINQKISLVYSDNIAGHVLMEDVAISRGYQLRVFDKMDEAIEWLMLNEEKI